MSWDNGVCFVTSMYAGILRTLRFFMILVLEYCTEKIQAFTAVPSVAAGRVYLDWSGCELDKSLTRFTVSADSSYFRASTCIQCTHYVEQVLGFSGLSGRLPMWELLQRSCYSWDVCSLCRLSLCWHFGQVLILRRYVGLSSLALHLSVHCCSLSLKLSSDV